jgi:multidrug efflux pump subunit AcrA (membrane-fusion protein)
LDDGGAARVVLDVVSDRGLPLPGAGVEVEVELTERGLALTVPEEAVRFARGGSSLFVVGKQQGVGRPVARRRAVRLGARGDGRVEVLDGLRPGDRVIVSGVGFLDDEQQVEEVRDVEDAASAVGAGAAEGEP